MSNKSVLGFIGVILLFMGTLMPAVNLPIVGSINFFHNGSGDGVYVMILAVIAGIFIFKKFYKVAAGISFAALTLIVYDFISIEIYISDTIANINTQLSGNPFKGLADLAVQALHVEWAWLLMMPAAILIIAVAFLKEKRLGLAS